MPMGIMSCRSSKIEGVQIYASKSASSITECMQMLQLNAQ